LEGPFSKNLDAMGKRPIGRQDVNSVGGFPGFKMRMICAIFHCAGNYPVSRTALNIFVRYFILITDNSLRIFTSDEVVI
jgi:hypothetical protein